MPCEKVRQHKAPHLQEVIDDHKGGGRLTCLDILRGLASEKSSAKEKLTLLALVPFPLFTRFIKISSIHARAMYTVTCSIYDLQLLKCPQPPTNKRTLGSNTKWIFMRVSKQNQTLGGCVPGERQIASYYTMEITAAW